jgi:hypothetical protein
MLTMETMGANARLVSDIGLDQNRSGTQKARQAQPPELS